MRRFFSKIKSTSGKEAKNRLKSVIHTDRMKLSENSTTEKIRKDVTSVLLKYAGERSDSVRVNVTFDSHSLCTLNATISMDAAL